MVKSYLNVLILFLLAFGCELRAQEKSIFGHVIDAKTKKSIANINILNIRSKQIVVTNEVGDFYMRARMGDSILISSFGYNRKGILWNGADKNPVIIADQQAIMLSELLVKDKSLLGLNAEIVEFLSNPKNSQTMKKDIMKRMLNTNTATPGAIGISIDALYDRFSKEGKQDRKLADLNYEDTKKLFAGIKYNRNTVASITKLEGEDLDTFMNFCKPNTDFILEATDYELTLRTLRCLNDFRIRSINGTIDVFKNKE